MNLLKNKYFKLIKKLELVTILVFSIINGYSQQGSIIPVNSTQKDFLKAYKFVLEQSDKHYRSTNTGMDKQLFPDFGEFSMYWITSGPQTGAFVYPDAMPSNYNTITSNSYTNYSLNSSNHLAVHFNRQARKVAIFRSLLKVDESSISWEAPYFKNLFDTYLFPDIYYYTDENALNAHPVSDSTELLIIPAINAKGNNYGFYADSIIARCPTLKAKLENFLARGGTIYTEGNAVVLLQKLGLFSNGTIDYSSPYIPDKTGIISITPSSHVISSFSNGKVFSSALPGVTIAGATPLASLSADGRTVAFLVTGSQAKEGKIISNLALPTVEGISKTGESSRQLQWVLNSMIFAFSHSVDVTRSVSNILPPQISTGRNTVSYDRVDTFDVKMIVRNLSALAVNNIVIKEDAGSYFKILDVKTPGISYSTNGNAISFGNISLPATSELIIEYRLLTPSPNDAIHESVDKFLQEGTLMRASKVNVSYTESAVFNSYSRNKDYANIMFSARIFADTDINWKNFLGLDYQPFKVFLIMENKERTSAENVVYSQYIPKDIPFYWTDNSIDIPILKTPGGKFVDILKGSDDQNHPDYDMDHDGKPDAWLDTASIYPKGYTITEEEVYWANPWNHLRTGSNDFVFEDIDHDGQVAKDTNGDGIVDIEEPGDKIRVWKITWNIGQMPGHQYYDPYCSMEVWVDPPDLVPLSAGVGKAQGKVAGSIPGMFIPYKTGYNAADIASDSTWAHWMDRDESGKVIYKQLIYQKINNYEGFTFIDTLKEHYKMLPTDSCAGTVPQPHREFIAVLSMGGEEIDMTHPAPTQSLYSKVNYKTIFGEDRVTPVRTTYTYYAPLPNPLQFEYLSDNFTIYDSLGLKQDYLPKKGKARIVYDIYPSTEYSYYWIRNFGHDVDYNDPSELAGEDPALGDGVFGYMVYDIPKGMGGYAITLPKNQDGSYNLDSIVKVEGKPFSKWLDNKNTLNQVEVWEDPFQYHVYIPQLLIPPALDDDNYDGIDDWKDDKGDRFQSKTGFLHDPFMPGSGESYPNSPAVPFQDDIYGMVTSGWDAGPDKTYGDDKFETLGKTHIQICANYEGKGREGNLDISKGGTVVVEEIFGGSPWVIFSHVMSGYARGLDYTVKSTAIPSVVKFGTDTVYIKHEIADTDEPHTFDANFDPYHVSRGFGEASLTAIAGGKDPCSLIMPDISTSAIIDPIRDSKTITIYPDASNSAYTGGPKTETGAFVELKVEVTNATNDNWKNTVVTPSLTALGNSKVVMNYVAYPRPLVPDDNIGTFTAGWRFNQPENEVLIKTGNSLPEIQPTRRAYFIFLIKVDPALKKGVYDIPFSLVSEKIHYNGITNGTISYDVPAVKIAIAAKNSQGKITEYPKFVIDKGTLKNLTTRFTSDYQGLQQAGWASGDVVPADFNTLKKLSVQNNGNNEVIDLSKLSTLPNADTSKLYILQKGIVTLTHAGDSIPLTTSEDLLYNHSVLGDLTATSGPVNVTPTGPIIVINNKLCSVNGVPVLDTVSFRANETIVVGTMLKVTNLGADVSQNTTITIHPGAFYKILTDSLPSNCTIVNNALVVSLGSVIPGESKGQLLYFKVVDTEQSDNITTVIRNSDVEYKGTSLEKIFKYTDPKEVNLYVYEFRSKQVTYENEGGTAVKVTAEAKNLGMNAANVWFRIYPVIDGGIREFPIAQLKADSFKTSSVLTLSGNYTIPKGHNVEFVAIIDDGEKFYEILENNNLKSTLYITTDIDNPAGFRIQSKTYPNPAKDHLYFNYFLQENMNNVNISIANNVGKILISKDNCPKSEGENEYILSINQLLNGNYYYKISATNKEKKVVEIIGKFIKN